ncbi:response regulator, partial [Enterococcus faecalis]
NIAEILVRAGMVVDLAEDGAEGLKRAASGRYHVIILDRTLPHLSGIDVVTRMRVAGIEAPVLMLSALGRSEHRVEGLESGVDDYMAKP